MSGQGDDPCTLTNCVCANHPDWPQKSGAWWTHLYAERPRVITPRGRSEAATVFVIGGA